MLGRVRDAAADQRAVSAIEFAMLAPLLILMYVGAAELGNALTISRRITSMSSTAADLVAQTKSVAVSDLQDVVSASTDILTPYPTAPLKIVLTGITADANNNGKVIWSYASAGASCRATGSTYPTPAGLTEATSSLIVAEVTYAFTPLLNLTGFWSPGSYTFTRTFYERPRQGTVTGPKC